jgi:hypothetical protein
MSITFAFDPPAAGETAVLVRFIRAGALIHERKVNAVFVDGVFDEEATEDRVEQVANGVKHKLEVGAVQPHKEDEVGPRPQDPPSDKKLTKAEKEAERVAKEEAQAARAKLKAERLASIDKAAQRAANREQRKAAKVQDPGPVA